MLLATLTMTWALVISDPGGIRKINFPTKESCLLALTEYTARYGAKQPPKYHADCYYVENKPQQYWNGF